MAARLIVMDTETTGIEVRDGHKIIEIGCVEMIGRRLTGNNFHEYIQPDRAIDEGALAVHGITPEFLQGKPRFADIMQPFLDYISGAELVIHNAPFDIGHLDAEFKRNRCNKKIADLCPVTDTLAMAREMYPGQRNSLDALCKRLGIINSHRTLHGALLDSEILADVYLLLTGGQSALLLDAEEIVDGQGSASVVLTDLSEYVSKLKVVAASSEEMQKHQEWIEKLQKEAPDGCKWV